MAARRAQSDCTTKHHNGHKGSRRYQQVREWFRNPANHLGCLKKLYTVSHRINYQPQLLSLPDAWTINSRIWQKAGIFFVPPPKKKGLHKKPSRNLDFLPCGFPITQTTNLLTIRQILSTCARPILWQGGPQWPLCLKVNPPKKTRPKFQSKQGSFGSRFTRLWVSLVCVMHAALFPNSPHPSHLKLWGKFRNSQTLYYTPKKTPWLDRRLTFWTWQPPCNSNWKRFFCIASWWLGNGAACRKILCCCTTQTSSLWPAVQMTAAGFAPRSIQARRKVEKALWMVHPPSNWQFAPENWKM